MATRVQLVTKRPARNRFASNTLALALQKLWKLHLRLLFSDKHDSSTNRLIRHQRSLKKTAQAHRAVWAVPVGDSSRSRLCKLE